ncbi:MAG: hypothetical protein R3A52_08290, partial [Polyangiales bacterium]
MHDPDIASELCLDDGADIVGDSEAPTRTERPAALSTLTTRIVALTGAPGPQDLVWKAAIAVLLLLSVLVPLEHGLFPIALDPSAIFCGSPARVALSLLAILSL